MENGIDNAAIKVDLISCKKNNRTRAVKITPSPILVNVSSTEALINNDLSLTKSRFTLGGSSSLISGKILIISFAIFTVLPSEALIIETITTLFSLI